MKPVQFVDTEVYRNYLLIGGRLGNGKVWSVEAVGEKSRLHKDDRIWLRDRMRERQTVGFNLGPFDLPIIYGAIAGLTVGEVKQIANDIIEGGMRSWDVEEEYGFEIPRKIDTVDLIEVAPGKASLKIYNGRLHGTRMQDLPIAPDATLTDDEIEETYRYWKNDLQATKLLHGSLKTQLELREALSKQHGIDLRSKSDAQVAEAIIVQQVGKILGYKPKKPTIKPGTKFRYRAPDYIRFHSDHMNDILDMIEDHEFRVGPTGKVLMPTFLSEAEIKIGTSTYSMGIGGLHSTEERVRHLADEIFSLFDVDVASYYPNIILTLGLYPKQLGPAFLKVYRSIVTRRLAAKDKAKALKKEMEALEAQIAQANRPSELMTARLGELKDEWHTENVANEGGKIMINGSFGKLGSVYSALFSPDLLLTVTLTGQLSLLMLIERLVRAGIAVVSGNTDGIVIKARKDQIDLMRSIVKKWEKDTAFETEEAEYSGLFAASVNNYIALKKGGGSKRKGHYAKSGLEEKKNPTMDICAEAVVEFLEKGTPISKTIRACNDIRKFVTVRTVDGGAIYGVKEVEYERRGKRGQLLKPGSRFDPADAIYLGKAVRFYLSTESLGALHYKNSLNKVPKSAGAKPLMQFDVKDPEDKDPPFVLPPDVDYAAYVREARQILIDIAAVEDPIGEAPKRKRAVAE